MGSAWNSAALCMSLMVLILYDVGDAFLSQHQRTKFTGSSRWKLQPLSTPPPPHHHRHRFYWARDVHSLRRARKRDGGVEFNEVAGSRIPSLVVSDANASAYEEHWARLLQLELSKAMFDVQARLRSWSRQRLEDEGMAVFRLKAQPDGELFGEKLVLLMPADRAYAASRKLRGKLRKKSGKHSSQVDYQACTIARQALKLAVLVLEER